MACTMEGKGGTGHLFVSVNSVHGKQERQRADQLKAPLLFAQRALEERQELLMWMSDL